MTKANENMLLLLLLGVSRCWHCIAGGKRSSEVSEKRARPSPFLPLGGRLWVERGTIPTVPAEQGRGDYILFLPGGMSPGSHL